MKAEAVAQMGMSFDEKVKAIPESIVLGLMKQTDLMEMLKKEGWPTDEAKCDAIGEKIGAGAEHLAAVSRYQRTSPPKKDSGETSVH